MGDRIEINIHIEDHIYYMTCRSFSGNNVVKTLCADCIAKLKANKAYDDMKPLAHIGNYLVCERCNACTLGFAISFFNVPQSEIFDSLATGKGVDIAENGVTLMFTDYRHIDRSNNKE